MVCEANPYPWATWVGRDPSFPSGWYPEARKVTVAYRCLKMMLEILVVMWRRYKEACNPFPWPGVQHGWTKTNALVGARTG